MSAPVTQDFTTCPYWGQGGRYVVDPATGQRTLVAAATAQPVAPTTPETPAADDVVAAAGAEKLTRKGK